jgi:hypothetical protein
VPLAHGLAAGGVACGHFSGLLSVLPGRSAGASASWLGQPATGALARRLLAPALELRPAAGLIAPACRSCLHRRTRSPSCPWTPLPTPRRRRAGGWRRAGGAGRRS